MYNSIEFSKAKTISDKIDYLNVALIENIIKPETSLELFTYPYKTFFNDVMQDESYVDQNIFIFLVKLIKNMQENQEDQERNGLYLIKYYYQIFIESIILNPKFNNKFLMDNIEYFKQYNYLINKRNNNLVFNKQLINFIVVEDCDAIVDVLAKTMYNTWFNYRKSRECGMYLELHLLPKVPFEFWLKCLSENKLNSNEITLLFWCCKFKFEQVCELVLCLNDSFKQSYYSIIKFKCNFNENELRSLISLINLNVSGLINDEFL